MVSVENQKIVQFSHIARARDRMGISSNTSLSQLDEEIRRIDAALSALKARRELCMKRYREIFDHPDSPLASGITP